MAVFGVDPSEWQRLDWQLLQNSPIALYFRPSVLDDDSAWFRSEGYRIYEFHCEQWHSQAAMFADFELNLGLADSSNFDALDDDLSDLSAPGAGGHAFVFRRFDAFSAGPGGSKYAGSDRTAAEILLDLLARNSRRLMLSGTRLIALVQSDDPRIEFPHVGCVYAGWNPKEWMNKNRGL